MAYSGTTGTGATAGPPPTDIKSNVSWELLSAATSAARGTAYRMFGHYMSFYADGTTSAGSGSAVIDIEVSNVDSPSSSDSTEWKIAGTITLTLGTTKTNDVFTLNAPYQWFRARLVSISGTGASVNCFASGLGA